MAQRVLVTGCNGYIGCMLSRILKERGHTVRGFDNRLYPENFHVPGYSYCSDSIEYNLKDVRDMTKDDFTDIDTVVHLAGLSNDPLGELNDKVTRDINVYGTVEMASQAKKAGVKKLVFASSCSVYGFSPMDNPVFFEEDSQKNPVSTYAESKLLCEGALTNMIDTDFSVIIMRNATVYGPSPRMRFDLLINAMVYSAYFNQEIIFYSNTQVKRPLINIEDLCNVFAFFVENEVPSDIYNVGRTIDNFSISDAAVLVCKAFHERFDKDIRLRYKIDNADPRSYLVSFKKLESNFGQLIRQSVSDNILTLIDNFAANFDPAHDPTKQNTSYYSIQHLCRRLADGELTPDFRVIKPYPTKSAR